MQFNLGCQLTYSVIQPSTFIFNIAPASNDCQTILSEQLQITPQLDLAEYISPVGNSRLWRINVPEGKLEIIYQATVNLFNFYDNPQEIDEVAIANLPMDVLVYLYPSRYCQSNRLWNFVQSEFGDLPSGYSRVQAICQWINSKLVYLPGSSNVQTSAYDTLVERNGICRDFAHLGIALCRALNIPARFVSGYAYKLEPPDFHACFEAFLGDRWYIFDPTKPSLSNNLIRIGTGRDAADTSFTTIFGQVNPEQMQVFIKSLALEEVNRENWAIANI
jgi:transglutaminase-like putative cysteine protease